MEVSTLILVHLKVVIKMIISNEEENQAVGSDADQANAEVSEAQADEAAEQGEVVGEETPEV